MISEKALQEAVREGVLSSAQAGRLQAIEAGLSDSRLEPQDEEKLRFVSGFGDVFVAIGLGLFLSAVVYFGDLAAGGTAGGLIAAALASWLLAEFFTRRRRMALPSIILLVTFCGSIFGATVWLIAPGTWMVDPNTATAMIVGGVLTALGALFHYARFHVPITIAAGVAGLVAIIAGILRAIGADAYAAALHPVLFACGIAVFAGAMRFDMTDPLRQTRRTDIAFWLHLLAAPLIVHPVLSRIGASEGLETQSALGILAVFIALAAVAVLVNRRAILVSGLAYAGIAFGALVDRAGFADTATPLTLLALGAIVLLLSAGWAWLRTRMLRLLPSSLRAKLPPDLAAPT